jgi:hypothetical protein
MNGVFSSVVSAMTQTPASGPRALATTPLMKPSAGCRRLCALAAPHAAVMAEAATQAAKRLELFIICSPEPVPMFEF